MIKQRTPWPADRTADGVISSTKLHVSWSQSLSSLDRYGTTISEER